MMCECKTSRMGRCFITGEMCTHQYNISRMRAANFGGSKDQPQNMKCTASVFVIMPFTDMMDASFKTIIKPAIENSAGYFAMEESKNDHNLICFSSEEERNEALKKNGKYKIVDEILVNRADQETMFGYIICNRVCQQIQIADFVIVDVSKENPNVFYEMGLALALGKPILPICFRDDYEKEPISKNAAWKRELFEYFSISAENSDIYNNPDSELRNYCRQTEDKPLVLNQNRIILNCLKKSLEAANNLLLYISGGIINFDSLGEIIINYYRVVNQFRSSDIFKGDRIAILAQNNSIQEVDKENPLRNPTYYNVPEILLLGVNQACDAAEKDMIQPPDVKESTIKDKAFEVFFKAHKNKRGFVIMPRTPLNAKEIAHNIYEKLTFLGNNTTEFNLSDKMLSYKVAGNNENRTAPYTLFNIMMDTLCYANQIVVDTAENDIVSLFWLGVAHGAGVYAIRVLRTYSERELQGLKSMAKTEYEKSKYDLYPYKTRTVFDVSGLWTAELRSDNIYEFYKQIAIVQIGISRHKKLLPMCELSNTYEDVFELYKKDKDAINALMEKQDINIYQSFESYYRRKIWVPLLSSNRLYLNMGGKENTNQEKAAPMSGNYEKDKVNQGNKTPIINIGNWDFQAAALLTNYLSTHTMTGEYLIRSIPWSGDISVVEQSILDNSEDNNINIGDQTVSPIPWQIEKKIINAGMYLNEDGHDYMFHRIMLKPINCRKVPKAGSVDCRAFIKVRCVKNETNQGEHKDILQAEIDAKKHDASKILDNTYSIGDFEKGRAEFIKTLNSPFVWIQPTNSCVMCINKHCKYRPVDRVLNTKKDTHEAFAQLLILKEGINENEHFSVIISGGAGPATYALSSLFVNEDIKYKLPSENVNKKINRPDLFNDKEDFLLTNIQMDLRRQILDKFENRLKNCNDEEKLNGDIGENIKKVKTVIIEYLRVLLVKYFIPFLNEHDISGVYNSMRYFVRNLETGEKLKIKTINFDLWAEVKEALENTVGKLVGIEVMFRVNVINQKMGGANGDQSIANNRAIWNMSIANDENKKKAIYLFMRNDKKKELSPTRKEKPKPETKEKEGV